MKYGSAEEKKVWTVRSNIFMMFAIALGGVAYALATTYPLADNSFSYLSQFTLVGGLLAVLLGTISVGYLMVSKGYWFVVGFLPFALSPLKFIQPELELAVLGGFLVLVLLPDLWKRELNTIPRYKRFMNIS